MAVLNVVKIILAVINVIANIVSSIFGIVLIGVGITGLLFFNFLGLTSESVIIYNSEFGLFIAIGFFLCLSALFEIFGSLFACFTNNRIVKTIATFLLAVGLIILVIAFILDFSGLIVGFVLRERIISDFVPLVNEAVNSSYSKSPNETQLFIENLQIEFGCCGINGPEDFSDYPGYQDQGFLPTSCCNDSIANGMCTVANNLNATGCGIVLRNGLVGLYGVVLGIGVFEAVIILLLVIVELILLVLVVKSEPSGFTKV